MRASIYVDGFNLYNGALKGTPFKWLDLNRLFALLFPQHGSQTVKYFTSRVKAQPDDPQQPIRQQMYLRALRTPPNIQVVFGHFLSHVVSMPVAGCSPGQQQYTRVIKTEEKGSDVNLAIHLVHDAHLKAFDTAVVVSNDSDLKEALRIVTQELCLPVVVASPSRDVSRALVKHASGVRAIRRGILKNSQFPNTMTDTDGVFHRPLSW